MTRAQDAREQPQQVITEQCLAAGELYFSESMRGEHCCHSGYTLKNFWYGGGNAFVCYHHAGLWLIAHPSPKSFLTEKILERKAELA
jgi:hypothetical protein